MELFDRFDVVIKLAYARALLANDNVSLWQQVYYEHLDIMTSGTYRESDGFKKGRDAYDESFKSILSAMDSNTFEFEVPLPVNKFGQLSDGAHRLSCAIATSCSDLLRFEASQHNVRYGLDLFYQNDFRFVGAVLEDFLLKNTALRLAIIWPSSPNADTIFHALPAKLIDCRLDLNEVGKINLVRIAYSSEHWLGSKEDSFSGAAVKAAECFRNAGPARLVVFDSETEDLQELKERLRCFAGVGKHSIHITDTHEETLEKTLDLLGSNPNEWINKWLVYRDDEFCDKLRRVESFVNHPRNSPKWYKIVGSTLLEYYGILSSNDLDVATAIAIKESAVTHARKCNAEFKKSSISYAAMNRIYVCGVPLQSLGELVSEYESAIADDKKQYYLKKISDNSACDRNFERKLARRRLRNRMSRIALNCLYDVGLYHPLRKAYRRIVRK